MRRFGKLSIGAILVALLATGQAAYSESCTENPMVLDGPDYVAIHPMFEADFNRAADLWNSDYGKPHNYGELFSDIVDKYGLVKFERFLSLISPMVRIDGAIYGENCASFERFENRQFDDFSFNRLLLGRARIQICTYYSTSGVSRLAVGVGVPGSFP